MISRIVLLELWERRRDLEPLLGTLRSSFAGYAVDRSEGSVVLCAGRAPGQK